MKKCIATFFCVLQICSFSCYASLATGISVLPECKEFADYNKSILKIMSSAKSSIRCIRNWDNRQEIEIVLPIVRNAIEQLKLKQNENSVFDIIDIGGKIECLHIIEDILLVFLDLAGVNDSYLIEGKLNENNKKGRWLLKTAKQYHNDIFGTLIDELFVIATKKTQYTFFDVFNWLS
jgi:hypothetical protein